MSRISLEVIGSPSLARGNAKVGKRIYTWSLPAGLTCPGKSALCERLCYAMRYRFATGRHMWQVLQNWLLSCGPLFVWWMVRKITASKCNAVRIHVAGDFYDAGYIGRWARVIRALPGVQFYAYTRSHAVPALRGPLRELSELRNMRLFYSVDREMSLPEDVPPAVRVAFLAEDADDEVPPTADLVFRDHGARRTRAMRMGGVLICPAENGIGAHVTCDECRLCLDPLSMKDPRRYRRIAA